MRLLDRLLAVADRGPRRLVGEEVPAQGVGPVAVEDLLRLAVVPLALRHLLAVFAEHQPQHDAVAEGMRIGIRWASAARASGKAGRSQPLPLRRRGALGRRSLNNSVLMASRL